MIRRILKLMGDWLAEASDPFADRMDAQHIESRIIAGMMDPVRLAADKTARNAIAQMELRDRAGDAHIADVEGE